MITWPTKLICSERLNKCYLWYLFLTINTFYQFSMDWQSELYWHCINLSPFFGWGLTFKDSVTLQYGYVSWFLGFGGLGVYIVVPLLGCLRPGVARPCFSLCKRKTASNIVVYLNYAIHVLSNCNDSNPHIYRVSRDLWWCITFIQQVTSFLSPEKPTNWLKEYSTTVSNHFQIMRFVYTFQSHFVFIYTCNLLVTLTYRSAQVLIDRC